MLGNYAHRLVSHGLLEDRPGLARQIAMRETAKLAMVRLRFSKSIQRAEVARSRAPTFEQQFTPGMIVYYFRNTKYNNKTSQSRRKLSLKRWRGPALLIAMEGDRNAFVSHRGQMTKVAREHLRAASTMEQIASDVWGDAVKEVVDAAMHDLTQRGLGSVQREPDAERPDGGAEPNGGQPMTHEPLVPGATASLPSTPLTPAELASALQPADQGTAGDMSRRTSLLSAPLTTAAPGTPVSQLLRGSASSSSRMQGAISRVAEALDEESSIASRKRPAEPPVETLQEAEEHAKPRPEAVEETEKYETLIASVLGQDIHPLRLLQEQATLEKQDPARYVVEDHGTWHGAWPPPSRTEWNARHRHCLMWPRGNHEISLVQTSRRECKWKEIAPADRPAFQEVAKTGWQVWVDNGAVEILSKAEADQVRSRLRRDGEQHRVLVPRFVYADKNDGLRTATKKLPLKANARLVVPGFRDIMAYTIRRDAPTGSGTSQHLLLLYTASRKWVLYSADVKSAFLKGEEFGPEERELFIGQLRVSSPDEPVLPLGDGGLARARKGIFGLADSPRRWYLRLNKSVNTLGWRRSELDAALWLLWSEDGTLDGMLLSHVDGLLVGGNESAHRSLLQLGRELGFGSLETGSFTYCGKKIEQLPDFSIKVSMVEYHENLKAIPLATERRRQVQEQLTPSEHKQLRGLLGSLQSEKPVVGTLLKANELLRKFKMNPTFSLRFHAMNLERCGLIECGV